MEEFKTCILCDGPAQTATKVGTGGNRFIIYYAGSCPTFEITRRAIKELQDKPHRKQAVIEKIRAFYNESPDDMPVIRMINASQKLIVTTRGREAELE